MIETLSELDKTRHRLLDAAGEVFSDVGYQAATVREICRRAGANVAAVNYHFGGKEQLYYEVLLQAHTESIAKHPPIVPEMLSAPAEKKLAFFIRSFFMRMFDQGRESRFGRLILGEMMAPTAALDRLVEQEIRPKARALEAIVKELLPAGAGEQDVRRCVRSVLGQVFVYYHARPVVERLHPEQGFTLADAEVLAKHVATFTLAALRNWPVEGGAR